MKTKLVILVAAISLATPLFAHRLDEYLQAIIVSVEQSHIRGSMRLIPGVAVSTTVIGAIDVNRDGVLSEAEQQTYAQKVLRDLSVSVDGQSLKPRLSSVSFPAPADMNEGTGEIHINFAADLPAGGSRRTLVIQNHHEPRMSVYLMNCLVPQDRAIQIIAQNRNQNQSYYRVEYVGSGGGQDAWTSRRRSTFLTALSPFAGVPSMFRLGMRHIAEGTDHLLFLIALLLPAPLLAVRSHWVTFGGLRHSLIQILRVVTAFTLGHSLTLALGASGLVSIPERPVEVLIAFSILISAAHALRPLFPGREPMIAAGFGLVHGLAFATTLQNLGVGAWQRIASILGFNLGIETMQLIVVAAILPSLILLSRTRAYTVFRFTGALFAGFASLGWIIERLFDVPDFVDVVVDRVAVRGAWIAALLFVISIVAWFRNKQDSGKIITEKSALGESEPAVA
jgi:HupE / UreJ protein